MSKFEFKPENFSIFLDYTDEQEKLARWCNETLEAHLETCPRVYCVQHSSSDQLVASFPDRTDQCTHTAVLMNVEKIKGEKA